MPPGYLQENVSQKSTHGRFTLRDDGVKDSVVGMSCVHAHPSLVDCAMVEPLARRQFEVRSTPTLQHKPSPQLRNSECVTVSANGGGAVLHSHTRFESRYDPITDSRLLRLVARMESLAAEWQGHRETLQQVVKQRVHLDPSHRTGAPSAQFRDGAAMSSGHDPPLPPAEPALHTTLPRACCLWGPCRLPECHSTVYSEMLDAKADSLNGPASRPHSQADNKPVYMCDPCSRCPQASGSGICHGKGPSTDRPIMTEDILRQVLLDLSAQNSRNISLRNDSIALLRRFKIFCRRVPFMPIMESDAAWYDVDEQCMHVLY